MKLSLKWAAAAILPIAMLASCQSSTDFYTIEQNEEFVLKEGRSDTLFLSLKAEFPKIRKDNREAAEKMSKEIKALIFGSTYEDMVPEDAVLAWTEQNAKEYRASNLELLQVMEEEGEETDFSLSWEYLKDAYVSSRYRNICGYTLEAYYYSGGAHGISYETNINFDTSTGNILSVGDVFVPDSQEAISRLLKLHVNDNRDGIELFNDSIEPNGNFCITEEGIYFSFDPYEIAPYCYGNIKIFLPVQEIKPYVNPELGLY